MRANKDTMHINGIKKIFIFQKQNKTNMHRRNIPMFIINDKYRLFTTKVLFYLSK